MPNPQTITIVPQDGNNWSIAYQQTSPAVSAQGNVHDSIGTDIAGSYARIYATLNNPSDFPFTGGAKLWATHNLGRALIFKGGYTVKFTCSYNSNSQDVPQYVKFSGHHDGLSSGTPWDALYATKDIQPSDFGKEFTITSSAGASLDAINAVELEFYQFTNSGNPYYGFAEIVIKKIEFIFEDFVGIDEGQPFEPPVPMCEITIYKQNFNKIANVLVDYSDDTVGEVTGAGSWPQGSTVTLTATPNPGFRFDKWILNCSSSGFLSSDPVYEHTVPNALGQTIYAIFEPIIAEHAVTVTKAGSGTGNVTGAGTYQTGSPVTVQAYAQGNNRFMYFKDASTGETYNENPHSFSMPASDVHYEAWFFLGEPAALIGNKEMILVEGYENTQSGQIQATGTNTPDYPITVQSYGKYNVNLTLGTDGNDYWINIAAGLKRGTYIAQILAYNAFNDSPHFFNFTLYVKPAPDGGGEGDGDGDGGVLGTVEVRGGIVPIRIPLVMSGNQVYRHVPVVELHEKRGLRDNRLFYSYELLGKNRGCLRLSRLAGGGALTIRHDRVIVLPKRITSQIDLPDNMIALLQAHLALAFAKKFNTPQLAALKEKAAQCSTWFARQQSAVDRDTFLDPNQSYARFGGVGRLRFRNW